MTEIALKDLEIVAFCDPAGGKRGESIKKTSARSAIAVVAGDFAERAFLLYAWAERCSTDRLIDHIFEVNTLYSPRRFGIEANAMQTLFAAAVRREARSKLHRIPIVEFHQPTGIEKPFRNRTAIQPYIASGRFLMLEGIAQTEAWTELSVHPMGSTCDIVDAIASCLKLLPVRCQPVQKRTEEIQLLRYLRSSGAPMWYIEKKLGELRSAIVEKERNASQR